MGLQEPADPLAEGGLSPETARRLCRAAAAGQLGKAWKTAQGPSRARARRRGPCARRSTQEERVDQEAAVEARLPPVSEHRHRSRRAEEEESASASTARCGRGRSPHPKGGSRPGTPHRRRSKSAGARSRSASRMQEGSGMVPAPGVGPPGDRLMGLTELPPFPRIVERRA